jgi:predicted ATPase
MMAQLHASGEPPLVGRDRERQRLRALLDEACAGHGSLVLVSGEAGIGKTTLVCDLIQQAGQQGALVLSGGCYDLTTTPPYGPWSEAIQGYQSGADQPHAPPRIDNADALQQVGSQMALFEKARRYFTDLAKRQPLVIILEDLHWADPASLELLRYLARTLRDAAILLIATYRDDEITRRHELSQFLPLLIRESGARRIHLNRLNRLSVERLIADRYGLARADHLRLAEHVRQRSGGNPFFAWEIVRGLENEQVLQLGATGWVLGNLEWAHVPPLLRQVLELQLARRSDDTREALQ